MDFFCQSSIQKKLFCFLKNWNNITIIMFSVNFRGLGLGVVVVRELGCVCSKKALFYNQVLLSSSLLSQVTSTTSTSCFSFCFCPTLLLFWTPALFPGWLLSEPTPPAFLTECWREAFSSAATFLFSFCCCYLFHVADLVDCSSTKSPAPEPSRHSLIWGSHQRRVLLWDLPFHLLGLPVLSSLFFQVFWSFCCSFCCSFYWSSSMLFLSPPVLWSSSPCFFLHSPPALCFAGLPYFLFLVEQLSGFVSLPSRLHNTVTSFFSKFETQNQHQYFILKTISKHLIAYLI